MGLPTRRNLDETSFKLGCPNIKRNRFTRWSALTAFQDSARSSAVEGSASLSLPGTDAWSGDGCELPRSGVWLEESVMQIKE